MILGQVVPTFWRLAQVGRAVYNQCLLGELSGKTRILVTNQLQYVSKADVCVFMSEGHLAEVGSYKELTSRGGSFAQLMRQAEVGVVSTAQACFVGWPSLWDIQGSVCASILDVQAGHTQITNPGTPECSS